MVEHGVTDLDDILKDRIAVLKSNRDRAKEALARTKVRPVGRNKRSIETRRDDHQGGMPAT